MKNYTFYVTGTHCASCKLLIEDILSEDPNISVAKVNLKNETLALVSEEQDAGKLEQSLMMQLEPHGYTVSLEKIAPESESNDVIWYALPIGLVFLVFFFLLQKSGILSLGIGGTITPVTSFLIGLVASVSSCLAVVGGLILSLSAQVTQDDRQNKRAIFLFHASRILGFALLGGLLGLLGKRLGVSFTFSAILGILSSLIMILLGLNLIGILKRVPFTLPSNLFSFFRRIEHMAIAPILIGVGTFFLPCGFTQSMQAASLASGSFVSGSLIMLAFASGTFPVLALLSFSSVSFSRSKYAPLFFSTVGVIVIGLGTFSFLGGLAGLGIIRPLFSI